jgi:hypothetical protein
MLAKALRPPFDGVEMPPPMRRLSVDPRGYPVPWFVDRAADKDGRPDFRIMDGKRLKLAIREHRCWVCGGRILGKLAVFVAGPMCGINRNSAEPPCHEDCAMWSARACPFLSTPKRIRDDQGLPEGVTSAGVAIARNPGVAMLWSSENYAPWKPNGGGVLFDIGDPVKVAWVCEGRAATRKEVMESVETGLPILLKVALQDGAMGVFELGRATERFLRHLPEE